MLASLAFPETQLKLSCFMKIPSLGAIQALNNSQNSYFVILFFPSIFYFTSITMPHKDDRQVVDVILFPPLNLQFAVMSGGMFM